MEEEGGSFFYWGVYYQSPYGNLGRQDNEDVLSHQDDSHDNFEIHVL